MVSLEDRHCLGWTEGVFDGMWNFFGQKREEKDPGRGNTQVGLFW